MSEISPENRKAFVESVESIRDRAQAYADQAVARLDIIKVSTSSAAIILVIKFISDREPSSSLLTNWTFQTAIWSIILFVLTITTSVIAQWISNRVNQTTADISNQTLVDCKWEENWQKQKLADYKSEIESSTGSLNKALKWLNPVSHCLFIVAISLAVLMVYLVFSALGYFV